MSVHSSALHKAAARQFGQANARPVPYLREISTRDNSSDLSGASPDSIGLPDPKASEIAANTVLRRGTRSWRERLAAIEWHAIDWAPDLAEEIGSRRWLRGFATLGGLVLTALAFWPNFEVQASPAMQADASVREEYRAQAIRPLAFAAAPARPRLSGAMAAPVSAAPERARIALTAVVAQSDSFDHLLQRAGVSPDDASRAAGIIAGRVPLAQITPGTRISLVLGPRPAADQPRPLESLALRARFDEDLALTRNGSGFSVSSRPIPVDTTPLRIKGVVGASLYRSARAAGAPAKAIQQYLAALDSHLNLESDILPGDSFDIIFANKRTPGGESQAGEVLYVGLQRASAPVAELMRWGNGQFYSADALSQPVVTTHYGGGMMMPVAGRITSPFGTRFHPILGYARMHWGVDFGAPWGSPIRASADGTITFAGYHGGHGKYVRIEHGGGLGTGYGHMSSISVAPGTRVQAGQVIGYVGSTGLSTGPHLHFEVYRGGRTVDPMGGAMLAGVTTTTTTVRQVDRNQLAAFKAKLAELKAIRPGFTPASVAMGRSGGSYLR